MTLDNIVSVIITRETQAVSEEGFGIPMILGPSVQFTDRIRYYSSMDEVALDFPSNTPEYIAAQDVFSQVVSPELIAIGRRQVNSVDLEIISSMSAKKYTIVVDGVEYMFESNNTATYSLVTLNGDLVTNNLISLSVNGTNVGTVTSIIDFDSDFVADNEITATVNGNQLSPITYTTDQATTIGLLATQIQALTEVVTATVSLPHRITVVFASDGNNTVNNVDVQMGVSQPSATISEGGFTFATSHENTMNAIASKIQTQFPTLTATVEGENDRQLKVVGPLDVTATVNNFNVYLGASQATAEIINPLQPTTANTIAQSLADEINNDPDANVIASVNVDDTITLLNKVSGTAYTVKTKTDISNPNNARVIVTQVIPDRIYTVTINGIDFSYRSPLSVQNASEIVSGLVSIFSLTGQAIPVTLEDNLNGSFEIISNDNFYEFSISVSPDIMTVDKGMIINKLVGSDPIEDDLTTINNINSDWYALISTERDPATVLKIAAWIQPRKKIFGTASSDPTIINVDAGTDQTSIAAKLNQLGYTRSFVMYHQDADYDYPEAAWFGRCLPLEPGSETWKFKTLNGISYSNLTTTQENRVFAKKANTYQFVGGVGMTAQGTMAQGEYIDIIRGIDWLTSTIQRFVFSVLVNNSKVAYTDAGIAVIEAEVMRALELGVSNNFIAEDPEYIVTVPRASEVPAVDKANRILRNVRFEATLSGAIHFVRVLGQISV